jgi:hypothetical protein
MRKPRITLFTVSLELAKHEVLRRIAESNRPPLGLN